MNTRIISAASATFLFALAGVSVPAFAQPGVVTVGQVLAESALSGDIKVQGRVIVPLKITMIGSNIALPFLMEAEQEYELDPNERTMSPTAMIKIGGDEGSEISVIWDETVPLFLDVDGGGTKKLTFHPLASAADNVEAWGSAPRYTRGSNIRLSRTDNGTGYLWMWFGGKVDKLAVDQRRGVYTGYFKALAQYVN